MKEKKTVTGTDVAIICSAIGAAASILLLVINMIDHESTTVGIVCLCACMANLFVNAKNKKNAR